MPRCHGSTAEAHPADGHMWPTAYALTALDAEQEERIAALGGAGRPMS